MQIRDETLTIFVAGHETTAVALTWIWYLLSQNPECEAQLHEEIDAVLKGSERFYAVVVMVPENEALARFKPTGNYGDRLRKHDYSSFFRPELAWLVRHPLLGAVAAQLSGSPSIRLWHDQLLYKPTDHPDRKANVGWHTDRGYWKTCTSSEMLTAWIPFHECTEEMGTITMVDGSHRWPDNTENLNFFSSDLDGLEKEFTTGGNPVIKTPINLAKGQVSFHNYLTIHGSGPNRTPQPRRSIAVHLQDESNRYRKFYRRNGELAHHCNDDLTRKINGESDYTDPNICPTLFSRGQ